MVLLKKSMDLLQMIIPSFHNHGEESRSHMPSMVPRTHHGNGSHLPNKPILETRRSRRKFMALSAKIEACMDLQTTQGKNMLSMVQATQTSNILNPFPKRQILETNRSLRKSMDLSTLTTACTQLHIQEKSIPSMEL
jgi:hypothetical protein